MNSELNILVSESSDFAPEAKSVLNQMGNVHWADLTSEELPKQLGDTDVLWVRLRSRIDAGVLNAGPNLKIIASPTTGLNHIDLEAAADRNIKVLSLKGEITFLRSIRATAEHTIGLMLALLRNVPAAAEHVKAGGWNRDLFRGGELCGSKVGVVGYGRLGHIVSRYLNAFESDVLVAEVNPENSGLRPPAKLVAFDELLETSAIVTIHVDLNTGTRNLFGHEQFQRMKPGAFLVNTSRGEVVDEAALIEALDSGRLAGAAVDVIADEHNYTNSPLVEYARHHSSLLITPHIGGCTAASMAKTEVFLAERLREMVARAGMGN